MPKHLLDLSTLEPDRPTIGIDGVAYELAVPDDFGLAAGARIDRLQRRLAALRAQDADMSEANLQGLAETLDELLALLVPGLPSEVKAKLRDQQKMRIMAVFMTAAGGTDLPLPPSPTGAS